MDDGSKVAVERWRAFAAEMVLKEATVRMQVETALRGDAVADPCCDAVKLAQRVASERDAARAEVESLQRELREVAHILLAEVGTDGPRSAEYAARLAVAEVQGLRARLARGAMGDA